jgi:glycosyltransferase involved in cell wall biosynthesis
MERGPTWQLQAASAAGMRADADGDATTAHVATVQVDHLAEGAGERPRVLFVARRLRLPLDESIRRRYEALARTLDWHQLAGRHPTGAPSDDRFTLSPPFPIRRLDGLVFHVLLPLRAARTIRRLKPDAVVVQGAHETALLLLARQLARAPRTAIVADVQGDWVAATRLYGSRWRGLLNPIADRLARVGLCRADAVRTITGFTSGRVRELGIEPTAELPTFMDFDVFTRDPVAPLPDRPTALFVGVLERYKGVDVLAEAWQTVEEAVPGARLRVVGDGSLRHLVERLVASCPESVEWDKHLSPDGVAAALDDATVLVLPSRLEGMGRVLIEAFCRGRGVIGTRAGGIPDVLEDGISGDLVAPDDPHALADALAGVLGSRDRAQELADNAAVAAKRWILDADGFAARLRAVVDVAIARRLRP